MLDPSDVGTTGSDGKVRGLPYLSPDTFARTYAARVHRFAAMVMKNDQDSADLAQEALIKAVRSLERFDPSRVASIRGCGASSSTPLGMQVARRFGGRPSGIVSPRLEQRTTSTIPWSWPS
ncbi:MAG: hypothetical protein JF886_16405 [Candidatus Dormibacteraeota bacterium]|uniref:RNA polymerase sigma-70 region 2 domain-containing protein n=1 Tax=Candidatus Aeolococcus gillhamiae TaxID=3127015 RepID=A0A934K0R0_9BACT|nr:hypothetical protein [Candidatus Dormibacteraeota bacterium]